MLTHYLKIGPASIALTLDCSGTGSDEYAGEGLWTFKTSELVALGLASYFAEGQSGNGTFRETSDILSQIMEEADADETADELMVSDADTAIRVLALMLEKGGEFSVLYESEGCPYWAFHDLFGHAVTDAVVDDGTIGLYVDGFDEEQAMVAGARAALEHRACDLADIVREFVRVEPDFESRFDYESGALPRFLSGIRAELIPDRN